MIKYLELTAPETSEFRQAKILSVEVAEGDQVEVGDTLFRVQSGSNEINLPATKAGTITEMIALVGENISVMTPLLLLETEVEGSSATPPLSDVTESEVVGDRPESETKQEVKEVKAEVKKAPAQKKAASKSDIKTHKQQSLNLNGDEPPVLTEEVKVETAVTKKKQAVSEQDESQQHATAKSTTMSNIQIIVPDIGTDEAKVIEIFVNVGDSIAVDDPLITLESDKASMDVPSTHGGIVKAISAQIDQEMSEGDVILELELAADSAQAEEQDQEAVVELTEVAPETTASEAPAAAASAPAAASVVDVIIPDIGGDSAKVIEILVSVGQSVAVEDPLVTLESDKASMDVPSSADGTIESIEVQIDQDVSEGVIVAKVSTTAAATESPAAKEPPAEAPAAAPAATPEAAPAPAAAKSPSGKSHASPSIRRFARELGVDLSKVSGTGRKNRITKPDVKQFVKAAMTSGSGASSAATESGTGIPPIPAIDFTKFGEVDIQPLNKIKRLTASNLHRSWLNVPHVTHNDESNINDLESFRKQLNAEYAKQDKGIKLSPLAFIVKAVVNAMQTYPQFNSSLEPGGENLIYKKYFNIGIAVETPNGLVVPVVKDADKLSVAEIAKEMGELAKKARDKKLTTKDMTGACFTISSLGGIGGTHFTPIVNAPEVAILGVSRSKIEPVWNGEEFEPGMILPLSLSYDHRVIDGAEAARFTRHVAAVLEDVRRLTV